MTYEDEVTADGPVAWWKGNDASGDLEDYGSGTDADLVAHGDPVYQEPSLVCDGDFSVKVNDVGSDDYFDIAMPDKLKFTGAFTFETWFMYDSDVGNLGTIMSERFDDVTDVRYALTFWSGSADSLKCGFGWYNGSWRLARQAIDVTVDTLYHYVGVYDDSGTPALKLYVNGVLDDTETTIGTQPSGTNAFQIARRWDAGTHQYLGGSSPSWLQHMAFYDYALSEARIVRHYNVGACISTGRVDNLLVLGVS